MSARQKVGRPKTDVLPLCRATNSPVLFQLYRPNWLKTVMVLYVDGSIYVDVVLNHMTGGGSGTGSDNSSFDGESQSYPAVPYNNSHFHGHAECPTKDLNIQAPPHYLST